MSWLGIVLVVVGGYFALKVVAFVLKLALWAVVLFGAYWVVSPFLGLPMPF